VTGLVAGNRTQGPPDLVASPQAASGRDSDPDDSVPIEGDQAMVYAINACGGNARISVYADVGHDVWNVAYDDPKLHEWRLQHRRQHASNQRASRQARRGAP